MEHVGGGYFYSAAISRWKAPLLSVSFVAMCSLTHEWLFMICKYRLCCQSLFFLFKSIFSACNLQWTLIAKVVTLAYSSIGGRTDRPAKENGDKKYDLEDWLSNQCTSITRVNNAKKGQVLNRVINCTVICKGFRRNHALNTAWKGA